MKTIATIAALTVLSISGANALSFNQVDAPTGQTVVYETLSGNGIVEVQEAQAAGISADKFNAADVDGNGKLSRSEFKNLG